MVAVPREMADRIKLVQNDENALTKFDLELLRPREVRVQIPVISRYDLRMVADCLRGLATILDFESRRQDIPERGSLFRVIGEVNLVNRRIRDHYADVYARLGIPQPKKGGRPSNDGSF
jgi:hypothetical protein